MWTLDWIAYQMVLKISGLLLKGLTILQQRILKKWTKKMCFPRYDLELITFNKIYTETEYCFNRFTSFSFSSSPLPYLIFYWNLFFSIIIEHKSTYFYWKSSCDFFFFFASEFRQTNTRALILWCIKCTNSFFQWETRWR